MRKAFTLIELLTVMLIMGLMGTAAIGGYRAMQRGMEERGVMQNANAVIRATYQRAQIDRQPTAIFFWNETLRSRTADENEVVVGKAVAIRRHGRLSNVIGKKLIDEFGDLNLAYPRSDPDDDGEDSESQSGNKNDLMYLYPMDNLNQIASGSSLKRSQVNTKVIRADEDLILLSGTKTVDGGGDRNAAANMVPAYAFELEDAGGVSWKAGMAYGFEFLSLQLPNNFIFGSSYSQTTDNPVTPAGTLVFKPGVNSGGGLNTGGSVGRNTVQIYSLRQSGGSLQAERVGTTDSPEREM